MVVVDIDPTSRRSPRRSARTRRRRPHRPTAWPSASVAETVERHGSLDGLVNNAALVLEGDLLETDMDNWRRTMALNVEAPFPWCKAAVPAMLNAGGGSIVNISSTEGIVARPDHFSYVTSKAALGGLTRSIAIDFGRRGIRCNTVSPGSIESERFREYVAGFPGSRRS